MESTLTDTQTLVAKLDKPPLDQARRWGWKKLNPPPVSLLLQAAERSRRHAGL